LSPFKLIQATIVDFLVFFALHWDNLWTVSVSGCPPGKHQKYFAEKFGGGGWWWRTEAGKKEWEKLEDRGMTRETLDWLQHGSQGGQENKGGKGALGKKGKKGEGDSSKQGAKGKRGKSQETSGKGERGEANRSASAMAAKDRGTGMNAAASSWSSPSTRASPPRPAL